MARKVTGFFFGSIVGLLIIGTIEATGHFFYPIPKNFNFEDEELLKSFTESLPSSALVIVIIAHSLGTFLGSFTGNIIGKSIGQIGLLISSLFLIIVITNILIVPYHPIWFVIADIMFTFIGGWIAFKITLKNRR
jgi:hypothetical protein